MGARVLLQVQPALAGLMSTCPGADLVLDERQPSPVFDVHLPILSQPQVLRSTLADLPAEVPYLACPDASVHAPKSVLVEAVRNDGRTRIGLAWHGNTNQKDNRTRSLGSTSRTTHPASNPGRSRPSSRPGNWIHCWRPSRTPPMCWNTWTWSSAWTRRWPIRREHWEGLPMVPDLPALPATTARRLDVRDPESPVGSGVEPAWRPWNLLDCPCSTRGQPVPFTTPSPLAVPRRT
jgi:hypothetical protein